MGDNFRESALVNSPLESQLQLLIERWQALSPEIQQQIILLDLARLHERAMSAQVVPDGIKQVTEFSHVLTPR